MAIKVWGFDLSAVVCLTRSEEAALASLLHAIKNKEIDLETKLPPNHVDTLQGLWEQLFLNGTSIEIREQQ